MNTLKKDLKIIVWRIRRFESFKWSFSMTLTYHGQVHHNMINIFEQIVRY